MDIRPVTLLVLEHIAMMRDAAIPSAVCLWTKAPSAFVAGSIRALANESFALDTYVFK